MEPTTPPPPVTIDRIRVRYAETDMMGHAYYGSYLPWLEQARGAWCRDRGFTYRGLEEMGFKLPVAEVWVKYRGEIKYDDDIEIHIWMEEVRRASMKFCYRLIHADTGRVVTDAYSVHVLVGSEMKAISIPPEVRELLNRIPGG
jgi:acyl-CoA thioester hydrolase